MRQEENQESEGSWKPSEQSIEEEVTNYIKCRGQVKLMKTNNGPLDFAM